MHGSPAYRDNVLISPNRGLVNPFSYACISDRIPCNKCDDNAGWDGSPDDLRPVASRNDPVRRTVQVEYGISFHIREDVEFSRSLPEITDVVPGPAFWCKRGIVGNSIENHGLGKTFLA